MPDADLLDRAASHTDSRPRRCRQTRDLAAVDLTEPADERDGRFSEKGRLCPPTGTALPFEPVVITIFRPLADRTLAAIACAA